MFPPGAGAGFSSFDKTPEGPIIRLIVKPHPLDFDPEPAREFFSRGFREAEERGLVPVLSCERLSGMPHSGGQDSAEIAHRLAELFGDAAILIGIRRQPEAILSMYKQYVNAGGAGSVRRYLEPPESGWHRVPLFDPDHFAYHRLIGLYRELFGAENVRVIPFERMRDDLPGYVARVATFAGVELDRRTIDRLCRSEPVNVSSSGVAIGVQRRLNRLFVRDTLNPSPLLPSERLERLIRVHSRRFDHLAPRALRDRADRRLRERVEEIVGDRFRDSNRATSELIGQDLGALGYVT